MTALPGSQLLSPPGLAPLCFPFSPISFQSRGKGSTFWPWAPAGCSVVSLHLRDESLKSPLLHWNMLWSYRAALSLDNPQHGHQRISRRWNFRKLIISAGTAIRFRSILIHLWAKPASTWISKFGRTPHSLRRNCITFRLTLCLWNQDCKCLKAARCAARCHKCCMATFMKTGYEPQCPRKDAGSCRPSSSVYTSSVYSECLVIPVPKLCFIKCSNTNSTSGVTFSPLVSPISYHPSSMLQWMTQT